MLFGGLLTLIRGLDRGAYCFVFSPKLLFAGRFGLNYLGDTDRKTGIFSESYGRKIGRRVKKLEEHIMAWTTPVVSEVCVGMEVTSYSSAEI